MRLCRFIHSGVTMCGVYSPDFVVPLADLARMAGEKLIAGALLCGTFEQLLPHDTADWQTLVSLVNNCDLAHEPELALETSQVQLLPPIARPPKLLLLAGNYAAHVREQGGVVEEKEDTFPYVFSKPPTTTLVGSGATVRIPQVSPHKIDHEVELAVVIGRRARNVTVVEALDYVLGYTVINDLSDRSFQPNPSRKQRPRDAFFDWLHGKWHDDFCPCGPCLVSTDEIPDPQQLELSLRVDGDLRQNGSTAQQVFSVAEVIAFLSQWVTLEPGDIISTGTPHGVGNASGKFLAAGQTVTATVQSVGDLITHMA